MFRIVNVVGARPNFMKIAPLMDEMRRRPDCIDPLLVHTGQHYHDSMNEAFFRDLDIPRPDLNLEEGSAMQTKICSVRESLKGCSPGIANCSGASSSDRAYL